MFKKNNKIQRITRKLKKNSLYNGDRAKLRAQKFRTQNFDDGDILNNKIHINKLYHHFLKAF